jgi:hypothetical protein
MDVFEAKEIVEKACDWDVRVEAVSPTELYVISTIWGSGRGPCGEPEVKALVAAAETLDLRVWTNRGGRDELGVTLPIDKVAELAAFVESFDVDGYEDEVEFEDEGEGQ